LATTEALEARLRASNQNSWLTHVGSEEQVDGVLKGVFFHTN